MPKPDDEPFPQRFAGALGLGALIGGLLTPVWFVVMGGPMAIPLAILIIPVAAFVWLGGLFIVGLPVWGLLHHFGLRSAGIAMAFGAGILLPAFVLNPPTDEGLVRAVTFIAMGPVVAWVVWRHAYGRRP